MGTGPVHNGLGANPRVTSGVDGMSLFIVPL
jgi:hypothetical protein